MVPRLEMLGRFEMDNISSGIDAGQVYLTCIAPFRKDAGADPVGFLAALRALIYGDGIGFVTYGACCLAYELLSLDTKYDDALALLDAGIAVKRASGLPSAALRGYEWTRWLDVHGPGTW
jgi:hypothetical protein